MEFDLGGIRKGETYQDEGFELVCGEMGANFLWNGCFLGKSIASASAKTSTYRARLFTRVVVQRLW